VYWNVDLPRLKALNLYWRKQPPQHVLLKILAQEMRLKPDDERLSANKDKPEEGDSDIHAMLQTAMMAPRKLDPNAVRDGRI
jgi:hypothetical protein